MICPRCNRKMTHVMSFSNKGNFEFNRCHNCYNESKHIPLSLDDLYITDQKIQKKNSRKALFNPHRKDCR